jgi:succinate-semialdehyde dehydrogenase/glutarate-semialdehyde dehydrogenase
VILQYTECRNPATGEIIGQIPLTPEDELSRMFAESRMAQPVWAAVPVKERARVITRVRDYILEHADEIADLITRDNGKLKVDALAAEVMPAVLAANFYAKKASHFLRTKWIRPGSLLLAYKWSREVRVPYGVVGIISPWNYPLEIPFHEIVTGLLCGNAVLHKASSETLLVGLKITECFQLCGLPRGLLHFVNMPGWHVGKAFLKNGIDKLFYTGSESIGKILSRLASETLTPLSLELGGNDPMLVCPDADIHRAAMGAVWGGLTNSGQNCGAVERIYVHEGIYEPFMESLKEKVQALKVGLGNAYHNDLGVLTTADQMAVTQRHLKDALQKGAAIYAQSQVLDGTLKTAHPAVVLAEVNHNMMVMQEETFGPLLPVMRVSDMEEAVVLANDSSQGLTASVWSGNRAYAAGLARRLKAGVVMINDHLMSHGMAETPWGGFKKSGNGSRTHGRWSFEEMTQVQVIIQDYFPFARQNMWWPPYSRKFYKTLLYLPQLFFGRTLKKRWMGFRALLDTLPRYFIKK